MLKNEQIQKREFKKQKKKKKILKHFHPPIYTMHDTEIQFRDRKRIFFL